MILGDKQKALITKLHAETVGTDLQLEAYFMDRFFNSKGLYGYPVMLELRDVETNRMHTRCIITWRTTQDSCERAVIEIEAHIAALEGVEA